MKKNIFAVVVLSMTLCGLSAFAQVPATKVTEKAKTEATAVRNHPAKPKKSPFDGINLTADQKTRLEALKTQQITERKQAAEQKKATAKAARQQKMAERAKRDSLKREEKLSYLHKVKDILTPEQYVIYLENIVVGNGGMKNTPGVRPEKRAGKMPEKMRGDKNKQFDKSQRPQKGPKPNKDSKK